MLSASSAVFHSRSRHPGRERLRPRGGYFGDGWKTVYVRATAASDDLQLTSGLGFAAADGPDRRAKTVFEPIAIETDYNMTALAATSDNP
jgi:hypothetical protein